MMRSTTIESRRSGARPAALLATAALALGLAATAWAGPGRPVSQSPDAAREADAAAPSASPGLSVAVDPATGKVRQPTAEEREALDRSFRSLFSKSMTAAPAASVFPDGTIALALTDEYLNVWVARVNPDGSITQGCVGSPGEADAFHAESAAQALEEM